MTHSRSSIYELLQSETYTPEEVASLLGIGIHIIHNAAFEGELPARIVGHDIVGIQREDVVAWYNERYRVDESQGSDDWADADAEGGSGNV